MEKAVGLASPMVFEVELAIEKGYGGTVSKGGGSREKEMEAEGK